MKSPRFGVCMTVALIASLSIGIVAQQASSSSTTSRASGLRTPWGEPDLQGIWSGGTLTPLERPARWADRSVLTPDEAAAYAAEIAARPGRDERRGEGTNTDVSGAYNEIFSRWGGGTAQLLDDGRTSLIVDPADGRIPPFTPEAVKRENPWREWLRMLVTGSDPGLPGPISPRRNDPPPIYNTQRTNAAGDPEVRGPQERCFGEALPGLMDPADFYRIVQSPGYVVIYYDPHQGRGYPRVIPTDGRKHLPSDIRLLHGDSVGRWEGDTLVVDTTNFTFKLDFRGARENLRLVERYTRASPDRIQRRVTLEDATTWARPWTFEMGWHRRADHDNQVYEASCHEGNLGIIGILAGRRAQERLYAQGRGPNPELMNIGGGRGPAIIPADGRLLQGDIVGGGDN